MLEEIERDGFFLSACREPIPLNVDYSNMQVPNVPSKTLFESSSETSLARTSSLEEAMGKRSSLYDDQKSDPSDNSAHRPQQLLFSRTSPRFLDCEPNVVKASHLHHYKEYYEISDQVTLLLPEGKIVWNPMKGSVAIYVHMLNCRVTLPL
ncbi:hypothetical protein ACOSQ4_026794 [Xanthoceras sorbifolium]